MRGKFATQCVYVIMHFAPVLESGNVHMPEKDPPWLARCKESFLLCAKICMVPFQDLTRQGFCMRIALRQRRVAADCTALKCCTDNEQAGEPRPCQVQSELGMPSCIAYTVALCKSDSQQTMLVTSVRHL
jgi:hypothetical protein